MAGIAMVLDLLRKNQGLSSQTLHSSRLFSATLAASVAAGTRFPSRALFGRVSYFGIPRDSKLALNYEEFSLFTGEKSIAYCDGGPAVISEDYIENYISSIRTASGNIFQNDSLKYSTKEYNIELKPLFSAFQWKSFALTLLRSLLLFYLLLLEPHSNIEEDDDDFLQDTPLDNSVDLVVPLKKSVRQIIRETSVVTTRRILERIAVHHVSQRMAWKLLKDVPKSAMRKAQRGMPTSVYYFSVIRTTFKGHFLGVVASWLIQVGIDIYQFFSCITSAEVDRDENYKAEQTRLLGRKVFGVTVRCGASLVFASIGAGIGSTFLHPSAGQWIGCAMGDLAGPTIVSFCFEKIL